jgi:hypothetical protein
MRIFGKAPGECLRSVGGMVTLIVLLGLARLGLAGPLAELFEVTGFLGRGVDHDRRPDARNARRPSPRKPSSQARRAASATSSIG